jgi:cytochrome c oxidase cbb3-type subunit 3
MSEGKRHDEIQGQIVHVYDDIEEADNNLPIWWLITFYGAIVFGAAYWFYYHELGMGTLPRQAYDEARAAAAAEQTQVSDESLMALSQDEKALAAGKEIFMTQCVACHDTQGQGREGLGPNLTDRYWIHGGAPTDIHSTVVTGVAAKGMPPWQPILGDRGVQQVVAYVLTLRNTQVEGKEPEGDLWDPNAQATPTGNTAEAAPMGDRPRDEPSADETTTGRVGEAAPDKGEETAVGSTSDTLPRDDQAFEEHQDAGEPLPRDDSGDEQKASPNVKLKALPFTRGVNEGEGAQTE